MSDVELKPCPFCAGEFTDASYDRGIQFNCKPCGYSRNFPGLFQTKKSNQPVPIHVYRRTVSDYGNTFRQEYIHIDAMEKAITEMNKRARREGEDA